MADQARTTRDTGPAGGSWPPAPGPVAHERLGLRAVVVSDEGLLELADLLADRILERIELRTSPQWMTVEEAADYVRIALGTFRRQVATGSVPRHRTEGSRTYSYNRGELDRWLLNDGHDYGAR